MASRTLRGAVLLALGAVTATLVACNTNPDVQLETYGDEAAEDYGCIVGDLECACAAGGVCDLNLTCVDNVCKCLAMSCEPMGPPTSEGDSSMGTDTMGTGTDTMGTDTMGTDTMGTDTMGTTTTTTTTDTGTDTTDTGTDTTTDTTTTDTGTDTGTTG